jgi:hypothetical protein
VNGKVTVVGIVSFGAEDCPANTANVYARVTNQVTIQEPQRYSS